MHVFVISLADARARRRHSAEQLTAAGVRFRFFDAIDGQAAAERYARRIRPRRFLINCRRRPVPSEIGCYASHLALWERCTALGRPIVVLEDDFELLSHRFARLLPLIERLTRELGFIRLQPVQRHATGRRWRRLLRPDPPTHPVRTEAGLTVHYVADVPTGMLGYSLSPGAAAALSAASSTFDAPVDRFTQWPWRHGVPIYGLEPHLIDVSSTASVSTIGARSRSRHPLLLTARLAMSVHGKLRRRQFNRRHLGETLLPVSRNAYLSPDTELAAAKTLTKSGSSKRDNL